MEIIVEIGNDNEKLLIQQEIEFFVSIFEDFQPPLNIDKIIVPLDFADKVNELEDRTDYTGKHGASGSEVGVAGKNILIGKNRIILLSPLLYTAMFDDMVRGFILIHEIVHVFNAQRFPKTPDSPFTLQNYLGNLFYFYDEYFSDRLAYKFIERVFKEPSELWNNFIQDSVENYLAISNDATYYDQISQAINSFRDHADVENFLKQIHASLSVTSIATVHAFARHHHIQEEMKNFVIPLSKFVNQKTINLMDYFKRKYEERSTDLMDGLNFIAEYFTNYGIRFEDHPEGNYVRVLDI